MIDHMGFDVSDYARSRAFYDAALAPLGIAPLVELTPEMTGGWAGCGYGRDGKPDFWFGQAVEGRAATSGLHAAFRVETRGEVDAFHAAALAAGGRDNGPPGIREHYHPNYYAAFVLDPDGVNVEAVCHGPAGAVQQTTY